MKVEPCDYVSQCMASPASYGSEIHYGDKSMKRISALADQKLAEAWKRTCDVHHANAEAIEHNKNLATEIARIMTEAGIPTSYLAPKPGSRSYYPKKIKTEAGYIGDIRRNIITDDGFLYAQNSYHNLDRTYREYRIKAEGEDERIRVEKEREAQIAAERRKADIGLAKIILRYEFPDDITWESVLAKLRERDQYLDLAVAGLQTRGDWSDGFYRVEAALGRFKIADDRDKEIAADICGCMSDQDDGRVFRDTRWSYDALFEIVADKQLLEDARLAMDNITDH